MAASCAKLQGLPCTRELHARMPVPVASGAPYKFEHFLRHERLAMPEQPLAAAARSAVGSSKSAEYISLQTLLLLRQERLAVLCSWPARRNSAAGGGNSAASAADVARAARLQNRGILSAQ